MTDDTRYEQRSGANAAVDAAARLILQPALRGEPSPILQTGPTWTRENARQLRDRIQATTVDARGFLDKLQGQLAGAPREIIALAAELTYIQLLPLSNVTAQTKRARVQTVLSWVNPPLPLPDELDAALDSPGTFNGGAGFNIHVWQHLLLLCAFIELWWALTPTERERALSDPWAFREVVASVPPSGHEPAFRLSFEELVWPGYFDSVVNDSQRRRIRNAFAHRIGATPNDPDADIDKDLLQIRAVLQDPGQPRIDWYEDPYATEWGGPRPLATSPGRHAWFVRPGAGGAALVSAWHSDGFVSLPATNLTLELDGADDQRIREAVDAGYAHLDYAQRLTLAQADTAFIRRMAEDDLVLSLSGDQAFLGVVASDPEWAKEQGSRLRRAVAWLSEPIAKADLPEPVPGLLDKQGDVVDLTSALDVLAAIAASYTDVSADPTAPHAEPAPRASAAPALAPASDALAAAVHIPPDTLQEYLDLLAERQQLVFYGPPGTGKTFLAEALGAHIVDGDRSRLRTVQFHPSYAYEDFFEGLRPVVTDGQVSYELVPGPLRRLVAEASTPGNEANAYVLVIDEMNRANLAKVFGELYYLLEYRDQSISLQYSGDDTGDFRLPKNLFIIGTMNTLDRSISMVDAAIRRRFPFVELHPAVEPVASVLRNYLSAQHADDTRAKLLSALNAGIDERDLQIGPSYLMKDAARTRVGLERIWKYDILPLLDDHFYGMRTPEQVRDQFGLTALMSGIGPVDVVLDGAVPDEAVAAVDTQTHGDETSSAESTDAAAATSSEAPNP